MVQRGQGLGDVFGDILAFRVRRIAATSAEIAGEVVVQGLEIQYVADKLGGAV